MTKQEFISELQKKLSGLPRQEVEERLSFYCEMIDDRIEEGRTEEEAVREIGTVEDIAAQIIADIPLSQIAKEKIKPQSQLKTWVIVLLVLGAPLWLPLVISAFSVLLSIAVTLFSGIISLWAVFVSLAACAIGGLVGGGIFFFQGHSAAGLATLGAGMLCAGLSIFLFFGCRAVTTCLIRIPGKIALSIKKWMAEKE